MIASWRRALPEPRRAAPHATDRRFRMRRTLIAIAFATVSLFAAAAPPTIPPGHAVATFAGGCFWCMEPPYDKLPGVKATISGYIGGRTANPTYEEVSSGRTGHTEAVQVVYDPRQVSFEKLLEVFWVNIDPTVKDRQFCDAGSQYRTGIFYHDDAQRKAAEASRAALEKAKPFREAIVTPIEMAGAFYPAEAYHQDYYTKNPVRYQLYRSGCGRDSRLKQLWGDKAGK
jgi:peptide-methionine (S)-S-oxide reductase